MESLKIAVIGCGQMGLHHARVYKSLPGVSLIAITELDTNRRAAAVKEFHCDGYADIERMYLEHPDITAVSITLPDNAHLEAVNLSIKFQKHILLEKPIAINLKEGKLIYDLAKNYNKIFTVGHLLRYDPRFSSLKKSIESDELGEIIHISARRNSPITGPRRYIGSSDLSMHVMVHDVDYINWFLGCKPIKVFAKARSVLLKEFNMTDVIYALITYENDTLVCLEASWVLPENSPTIIDDQVEVVGSKGVAYIDSCDRGIRFATESRVLNEDSRHWPYVDQSPSGDLKNEILAFLAAINHKVGSLATAKDAYNALVVIQAIEESIAANSEIPVLGWES